MNTRGTLYMLHTHIHILTALDYCCFSSRRHFLVGSALSTGHGRGHCEGPEATARLHLPPRQFRHQSKALWEGKIASERKAATKAARKPSTFIYDPRGQRRTQTDDNTCVQIACWMPREASTQCACVLVSFRPANRLQTGSQAHTDRLSYRLTKPGSNAGAPLHIRGTGFRTNSPIITPRVSFSAADSGVERASERKKKEE